MLKKRIFCELAFAVILCGLELHAERGMVITTTTNEKKAVQFSEVESVSFTDAMMVVESVYGTVEVDLSEILRIDYLDDVEQVYTTTFKTEGSAEVFNPFFCKGVTTTINGNNVTTTNSNVENELVFALTGSTTNGSYVYNGDYKCTIRLDGVKLASTESGAIDIECGKRIAVELVDGTVSTLSDAAKGKQKACFYVKGHPEFTGSGVLEVTGNSKHAIRTKEYMQMKKSCGTIRILSSANDGIHAGQYFQMNGGVLEMNNLTGDGVQVEATGEVGDENDGQMIIKGGTMNISCTSTDVACVKADSTITISGGVLTLNATGDDIKGIKGKRDVNISGGTLTINVSGNVVITDGDPSYSTAIKADSTLTVAGGKVVITNSAQGGKGLSADDLITISGGEVNVTCTGDGALYDPTSTGSASGETYVLYVNVPSSSTGGWGAQQGAWRSVYLYDEAGTKIATLSSQVSVTANGRSANFYYYDFKQPASGNYYVGSDNYRSGSTTYTIKSGTFAGPTDGVNHFYQVSSTYSTSGGVRTYSVSDVTSTYQNGTIKSDGEESYSANCIKSDKGIVITGGTVTTMSTGKGGKGINTDGDIVIGEVGGDGPTISVSTTGSVVASSGSGMNQNLTGQPKAIKAYGDITINSGNITCSTKQDGGEGIESKSSIVINGGVVASGTYDDALNAAVKITVNGGVVWAHATGNDGIDCNGSQGFEFNGGIVISSGASSPEEGFDCDQNSFVINGGTLIGTGGSTSSVTKASQAVATSSGVKFTAGTYLSVKSSDGTVLCSYKLPNAVSSGTALVSMPEFVSDTSYTLVYGATAVNNPSTSLLDGVFTTGGTLTGGTSKTITPKTK